MNFELTDEQKLIQEAAKEFADTVIAPHYEEIERTNETPQEIIDKMAECGFAGTAYPEEFGGAGADYLSFVLVMEQIARYSAGVASILANNNLAVNAINRFGTQEQKQKYLPDCLAMKKISSFAFTEPSTGSDPKSIESRAVLDGDEWVLNGTKRFISLANFEGPLLVFATDDQSGIPSAFIVDKFCEGYSIDAGYSKVGLHGALLNDIFLEDVRIPKENILGEPGKGFRALTANIAFGKLSVSTIAMGRAAGALEAAIEFAEGRTRRGIPITSYPTLQYRLADMAARLETIRTMVYRLAWIAENWTDYDAIAREAAKTKLVVTRDATEICHDAMQVCGSYGATLENRVEGMMRDCSLLELVEGVDDVQHVIVAHNMGLKLK